jgi:hypothetical protein
LSKHYNEWANALTRYFFGPHMAKKRTRLSVNREFLNEEFGYLGGLEGFISAVRNGPDWSHIGMDPGIHDKATAAYKLWKRPEERRPRGYPTLPNDAPPYIPFLVLLCLAWTVDDDQEHLAGHSFYERLKLIFPDHELDSIKLSKWEDLWQGLEDWTNKLDHTVGIWQLERVGQKYVGVPCSQTILTPCKLRRLPWLFNVTGLAAAARNKPASCEQVKTYLFQYESYTRSVLGNFLTKQISDDTEIGRGVIGLIQEQLENPENLIYEDHDQSSRSTQKSESEAITTLPLRIALEISPQDKWDLRYCLLEENAPAGHAGEQEWAFIKKGTRFWIAQTEDRSASVDEADMQPEARFQLKFQAEDEDGVRYVNLSTRKRGIRFFRNWVCQNFLFEEYDIPSSGGCYLLAHKSLIPHLNEWLSEFEGSGGKCTRFPQDGLPESLKLFYIEEIENSNLEVLSRFPEKTASTKKPSFLSFIGGSRIPGAGAERLYLGYDLPTIIMESNGEVGISATGAKLLEIHQEYAPKRELPGCLLREFEIETEEDAASATFEIISIKNDSILESRSIGITQHLVDRFEISNSRAIQFDRFGQATNEPGIFGSVISPEQIEMLKQHIKPDIVLFHEAELYHERYSISKEDKRWDLLESLCLKERISAKEFRRKVESITGEWQAYSWSELRWLRALGHVEVQRDKKGRIAYIYPVQASAYKLPWEQDELSYFAIAGCPTHADLDILQRNISELECEIYEQDRHSPILPPLLIIRGEEDSIRLCLDDAGFRCTNIGDKYFEAAGIAAWAGSLEEKCEGFYWQPGSAHSPESVFNPYGFRMLPP